MNLICVASIAAAGAAALAGHPGVVTSTPITIVVEPLVAANNPPQTIVFEPSNRVGVRPATVLVEPPPTNLRVPTLFFRCGADLDFDSDVDTNDLNILLSAFGRTAAGDLDFDGDTDSLDLNLMLATFGDACTPPMSGGG